MTSGLKIGASGSGIVTNIPKFVSANCVGCSVLPVFCRFSSSRRRPRSCPRRQARVGSSLESRITLRHIGYRENTPSIIDFNARASVLKTSFELQGRGLRVLSWSGKRMELNGKRSKPAEALRGSLNTDHASQAPTASHAFVSDEDSDTPREDLWDVLADSHCHPQEDIASITHVTHLRAKYVAVMATRRSDWGAVAKLCQDNPRRVIPCFGVHPWFCHLHALKKHDDSEDSAAIFKSLLQGKEPEHVRIAAEALVARGQTPIPVHEWQTELRRLLLRFPKAVVGEFGLDRAAVLLDLGVRNVLPSFEHQMKLTQMHLQLAAELNRPVSMHCVRSYGHMQQMFRSLEPENCPPKVMLHSFGGSSDMIPAFTNIPKIGNRFYFSFSYVINHKGSPQKLMDCISKVPNDRLLIESDVGSAYKIDQGLFDICQVVSSTKEWTIEDAARITYENFERFFEGHLPDGQLEADN